MGTSAGSLAASVYKPIAREEFEEVFNQVERWGLDQYLKDRSFDSLVYRGQKQ